MYLQGELLNIKECKNIKGLLKGRENVTSKAVISFVAAAAAAAKSLQSYPTLWDPIDGSPPGFPIPEILQARTLEWAYHLLDVTLIAKTGILHA